MRGAGPVSEGRMSEPVRAPVEVERTMLTRLNAELRARGATDVLDMQVSQEVRGEFFVIIVTPDVGEPFELLMPYVQAFPGLLVSVRPHGNA
jgi:hypothetical protein